MVAQVDQAVDQVVLPEVELKVLVPQGKDMLVALAMEILTNRVVVEAAQAITEPMVLQEGHMAKVVQAALAH
jgi:hypothetical protein